MSKHMKALIEEQLSRRQVLQYSIAALFSAALPASIAETEESQQFKHQMTRLFGFKSVAVANLLDHVIVPEGYRAEVFYRWGDPISDGPQFKMDGSNTAMEQLQQAGMHHDAIQFYPLPRGESHSEHGLLVMNHEYIDAQILHADGGVFDSPQTYNLEKTLKEQYAHGVSVIEVKKRDDGWQIVRPSSYARRLTAVTPMKVSGPVARTTYIQTQADPIGEQILGTFNNCSNGMTPWGTYLSCEENFNDYFDVPSLRHLTNKQQQAFERYHIKHSYYGWHNNDERFNASMHPNEPNRFGWIIEFDPYEPSSTPVKRTALGRFAHENVAHKIGEEGRIAFYSGDDSQFEYVYKFITKQAWDGTQGMHHGHLLDEGTLYVARFEDEGHGEWLPLVFGENGLTQENGFEDQADVLVHARQAADKLGATPMDRPEWITVHPETHAVYISMTKNSKRGEDSKPSNDAANPRNTNKFGHIIKLLEHDATSLLFDWNIFSLAGNKQHQGTIQGDLYANPDGLMIDKRGILWLQTDISSSKLNSGEYAQFGNNQMLAVDPSTGETRRFLTGPNGCEITGVVMTPDSKTMWVNIQHPGEVEQLPDSQGRKKSAQFPNASSNWPDHQPFGRPRSATVVISKDDGGIIGT
jgi:secreted PhoX family phosphatase